MYMKKVMTIAGTRPELIRLSEIIRKLDVYTDHIFVHTGQNFTKGLHDQFFDDMDIRRPDYQLNLDNKTGMDFIGNMLMQIQPILKEEHPDAVLILGDTNSGLCSIVCKKLGIPVFHMEAGNRCYSDAVPEEVNRRIIDTTSTYLLPYTQRSREQLLLEGYPPHKIIVTGNPIAEVIAVQSENLNVQTIKFNEGLLKRYISSYVLVTLHRDENVTDKAKLLCIVDALNKISETTKVVLSVHPKLSTMIDKYDIKFNNNVEMYDPFNFTTFILLLKNAGCVLTDSGTIPEEACILKIPSVLIRDSTERPELLENNSMILSGTDTKTIIDAYNVTKDMSVGDIPADYKDLNVSDKIVKIVMRCIS